MKYFAGSHSAQSGYHPIWDSFGIAECTAAGPMFTPMVALFGTSMRRNEVVHMPCVAEPTDGPKHKETAAALISVLLDDYEHKFGQFEGGQERIENQLVKLKKAIEDLASRQQSQQPVKEWYTPVEAAKASWKGPIYGP